MRLQEDVGLQVVTDGEFRRRSWFQDFVLSLTGTEITFFDSAVSAAMPFQDDSSVDKLPGHIVRVTRAPESRRKESSRSTSSFCKGLTSRTPKISLPSPSMLHFWGGRACDRLDDLPRHRGVLGRRGEDMGCWRSRSLHQLGCRYVQIDDVTFPLICDPRGQEALRRRGDDPHAILETYATVPQPRLPPALLQTSRSACTCAAATIAASGWEAAAMVHAVKSCSSNVGDQELLRGVLTRKGRGDFQAAAVTCPRARR